MYIQLLSFKYDVCHKEFEPKWTAASWNATSSCLLSSHFAKPCGHLRMHITSFKAIVEEHASSAHKTLAYTTGTTSKHQRAMWLELYPKTIFLRIVAWHMRGSARLQHIWGYGAGCYDVIKNAAKNSFLLRILKLPCMGMWKPRNPNLTYISCMFKWPDIRAYRDWSTTCCILLFDPCIKHA